MQQISGNEKQKAFILLQAIYEAIPEETKFILESHPNVSADLQRLLRIGFNYIDNGKPDKARELSSRV